MKRIITLIFICTVFLSVANGQKINEKEAQGFLEKTWSFIKSSDSVSFINLWPREDSTWQKYHVPYDRAKLAASFNDLRNFLRTAISENLDLDHIQLGKEDTRGTEITAIFKTKELAKTGFSLHVIYLNKKLILRGDPGFLYMTKNKM